jgi:hypothetical protein
MFRLLDKHVYCLITHERTEVYGPNSHTAVNERRRCATALFKIFEKFKLFFMGHPFLVHVF